MQGKSVTADVRAKIPVQDYDALIALARDRESSVRAELIRAIRFYAANQQVAEYFLAFLATSAASATFGDTAPEAEQVARHAWALYAACVGKQPS